MSELTPAGPIPPPPSGGGEPPAIDMGAYARQSRELAERFAATADDGPNGEPYDPNVVLTALKVFAAMVIVDVVPPERWEEVVNVVVASLSQTLKDIAAASAEETKQ